MPIENSIRVMDPNGDTVAVELVLQDGGAAAALRVREENWQTPATLREVSQACIRMADMIEARG